MQLNDIVDRVIEQRDQSSNSNDVNGCADIVLNTIAANAEEKRASLMP